MYPLSVSIAVASVRHRRAVRGEISCSSGNAKSPHDAYRSGDSEKRHNVGRIPVGRTEIPRANPFVVEPRPRKDPRAAQK